MIDLTQGHDTSLDLSDEACSPSENQTLTAVPINDMHTLRPRATSPGSFEGHPTQDATLLLSLPSAPKAYSDVSGIIDDGGDSIQLEASGYKKPTSEFADLAYFGAHLPSTSESERLKVLPEDLESQYPDSLNDVIRGYMINAAGSGNKQFLPLSELDMIITIPSVESELKRIKSSAELRVVAQKVLHRHHLKNGELTTRRKLFAILCLMEQAGDITDFISQDVYDSDLPFSFQHDGVFRRSGEKINLFDSWKDRDRDSFKSYQGQVTGPYFVFTFDPKTAFKKYLLDPCVVLPFVEEEAKKSPYGDRWIGGTSVVHRVRIHSSHCRHDENSTSIEKVDYAVKALESAQSNEGPPNPETEAYRKLNQLGHPHIVRLLATYQQNNRLHLIFPWADGNLYQFWERQYPDVKDLHRGTALAKWLVKQFLGLSQALDHIHNMTSHTLEPDDRAQKHGRHGDIKPENFLWFRGSASTDPYASLGDLKFSDLGSAEFHASRSQNVRASTVRHYTSTYRAPEFDKMKDVSQKADIWSFGCVLMEFLTWYLQGKTGLEAFKQARSDDSNLPYEADHFFDYDIRSKTVSIKESVTKKFNKLREAATSDLSLDLLSFIEDRILLPRDTDRATSKEIAQKFEELAGKCHADDDYCCQITNRNVRRSSTGESAKVLVPLSAEQQADYESARDLSVPDMPASIVPSINQITKEDDQSGRTLGEHLQVEGNNRALSSNKSAISVEKDTQSSVQIDNVDDGNRPQPEVLRTLWHRRVLHRLRKAVKGCFKPDGVG